MREGERGEKPGRRAEWLLHTRHDTRILRIVSILRVDLTWNIRRDEQKACQRRCDFSRSMHLY